MSHENSQHIVVVGTKPDIIKQAPIYHELRNRGHDVVLCHTGQHYDHNLSQSMLDEFGVREDVNLEVRGGVNDLVSGITAKLALYLRGFAERGGFPITYVHGDTTTAMAGCPRHLRRAPGAGARRGRSAHAVAEAGGAAGLARPGRRPRLGVVPRAVDRPRQLVQGQPRALARAVQHPRRRRGHRPARRAGRAQPRVPRRRGLRAGRDRRRRQLGRRRPRPGDRRQRQEPGAGEVPADGRRLVPALLRAPPREHHQPLPLQPADGRDGVAARAGPPRPLHPPARHRGRPSTTSVVASGSRTSRRGTATR